MARLVATDNADLVEEFLASQKPLVSAQGYVSLEGLVWRLVEWFEEEGVGILQVGIQEALAYGAYLAEKVLEDGKLYSTGTVHNYLKTGRRLFDYLVKTERLVSNPFREVKYPRLGVRISRNVLSESQMGRLLRELGDWDKLPVWHQRERRYRVHVVGELLYATGLRIAEAASLCESDLDLPHRLIYLKEGKGGKPRTVFLTSYACDILDRYLKVGRRALWHGHARALDHTLFGTNKARLAAVVNEELEKLCLQLDLPVITTHGFRHSLGTHLLRSGCDMRYIQAILGHEALGTTQVYTRVDKDDLKRSLDEFHPRRWNRRES